MESRLSVIRRISINGSCFHQPQRAVAQREVVLKSLKIRETTESWTRALRLARHAGGASRVAPAGFLTKPPAGVCWARVGLVDAGIPL